MGVLDTSTKTIKELLFLLFIVANVYFSYKLYILFNTDIHFIGGGDSFSFSFSILMKLFTIFVALSILESVIFIFMYKKFKPRKRLATGQLLTWKDIKSEQRGQKTQQFYTKRQAKFRKEKSALPVSRNLKITTKKMFEHIALFGPTGSGKSSTFFVPILCTVSDASFVITDPKGELFRKTYKDLQNKGILALHLNLTNPNKGNIGYSLLKNCKMPNDVRKLSESIMGNDQWGNISKPLLQCFLFKEWVYNRKNPSLKNVIFELLQVPQTSDELDIYFSDIKDENITMSYLKFKTALGSDGLTSSIFNTVIERTQVFEYDNLKQIEEKRLFPNEILRKSKIALFLSYPEEESTIYQPFLSSFYSQLFNQIKSEVNEFEGDNKGYPVYFLLDEAANIGVIPGFSKLLTTIRSKDMGILMGIQSISQLESVYGHIEAKIIIENAKTKIGLSGMSGETAKFFSDLCGEEEYISQSISHGDKNNLSVSNSVLTKKVMTSDEVRRLKTHEVILIGDNLRPIKDYKNFYYYDKVSYLIYLYSPFSTGITELLISKYQKLKKS